MHTPVNVDTIISEAAIGIGARIDHLFAELDVLVPLCRALLAEQPARKTLGALRAPLLAAVRNTDGLADGMGLAAGRHVLSDTALWLEWWRVDASGTDRFAGHSFDPRAVGYYDYTAMSWFRAPLETGQPSAVGPYLDNGGTNLRVVTLSVAAGTVGAVGAGDTAGEPSVLGADVSLDALERLFLRALGFTNPAVALVSASGKVIVSNSSRYAGASIVDAGRIGGSALREKIPSLSAPELGWQLVKLEH